MSKNSSPSQGLSYSGHPLFFEQAVVAEIPVDLATMPVYRSGNFPKNGGPAPWLDLPDAQEQIARRLSVGEISNDEAELCRNWSSDGYVILKGFYPSDLLDRTWAEYEKGISEGTVKPPNEPLYEGDPLPGRLANVHFSIQAMDKMLFDKRMSRLVSLLLGKTARPFQTIIGHKSSQQLAHSDTIHMTTYPNGYLAASWVAYEDIHPDSGPLVYYPGSHRLPYLMSEELGIPAQEGYNGYATRYEPAIQELIAQHDLPEARFLPQKGDILLWHANLLHGGSRVVNQKLSRKALVCHFFAEGCICFHDLTGTLTHTQLGHNLYTYSPNANLACEIDALMEEAPQPLDTAAAIGLADKAQDPRKPQILQSRGVFDFLRRMRGRMSFKA